MYPAKFSPQTPIFALKNFKRVKLAPGLSFALTPEMLALANVQGKSVSCSGPVMMWGCGALPGARSVALVACPAAKSVLTIKERHAARREVSHVSRAIQPAYARWQDTLSQLVPQSKTLSHV